MAVWCTDRLVGAEKRGGVEARLLSGSLDFPVLLFKLNQNRRRQRQCGEVGQVAEWISQLSAARTPRIRS